MLLSELLIYLSKIEIDNPIGGIINFIFTVKKTKMFFMNSRSNSSPKGLNSILF